MWVIYMKRMVGVVVLILLSSMVVSGLPVKNARVADVLIYTGSGVWDAGVVAFEQFLAWKGLTFFAGDDTYIENNDLIGDFDVIFIPGGDFTLYASQINSVGVQHIRDFVNAGGGYLGICGGGYFACEEVSWRGQPLDMPLGLFNGSGYGPINEIAPWLQYDMTTINLNTSHPLNHYESSTATIVYYGGAAFYPSGDQPLEIIGTYDEYNDDIAILDFYYGSGRILLYGPHPEIEEDSARDAVTFADELFDQGTDWNMLWTGMDWLRDRPISEPPASLPPDAPVIEGASSGAAGTEYTYTFSTGDPEEEELYYWIDWGDDTPSKWEGPYHSNESVSLSHTWDEKDTYTIQCKAKDMTGGESNWSEPFIVSMPTPFPHPRVRDILLDVKLSLFMRLAKYPSLYACVIKNDEVIRSNGYGYYDLEENKRYILRKTYFLL